MQPTLTLKFQNEEDRAAFLRFMNLCKNTAGTPGNLSCGITAATMRRAHITEALPEPQKNPTEATPHKDGPRNAFEAIHEVSQSASAALEDYAIRILKNLTVEEFARFTNNSTTLYRLAKLLVVSSESRITRELSAESFTKDLRALRRIIRNRYV